MGVTMRKLGLAVVLGLSASTFACGGTPHDSPDDIVFGAPLIMTCPGSDGFGGVEIGDFGGAASGVATCQTDTTVSTFINDGAGAFRTGALVDIPLGVLEIIDIDGDGLSDVVSANPYSDGAQIAFARKDGTFAPPVAQPSYPSRAEKRYSIDGMRDAFVYDDTAKTESFYDLASDGSTSLITTASVPSYPYFADVDGDGNVDMAFAVGSTVAVELGTGRGQFGALHVVLVADQPVKSLAFEDIDGNGLVDLIAQVSISDDSSVYSYALALNENGSFRVVNEFPRVQPVDYYFQDVTGDGIVDLVLSQDAQILLMVGKGDGTFADKPLLVTGPWTKSLYVFSDLNGDGKPDLVVSDGVAVSVLLRQ